MHDIKISNDVSMLLAGGISRLSPAASGYFVISDEITHKLCWPVISQVMPGNCRHLVIGAGELNKNLHTCQVAWKQLLQGGADRHSVIINLGGGVVTDTGGFVAATFMRGIRFINIPTSLLGMVDAAIGGKTGVDLEHYKNIIGCFAFPESVLIYPQFLSSLPDIEWKNGMVEMLKHGLIGNELLWKTLSDSLSHKGPGLTPEIKNVISNLIAEAVKVKSDIVSRDPEEKHERKFLNFGHTIGHALESWSIKHSQHPISHGKAVAIGIICESYLSEKFCGLSSGELKEIVNTVSILFSHEPIQKTAMQEIIYIMRADKKSNAGAINMALLKGIGNPVMQEAISIEMITESLNFYNSTAL